MAILVVGFAVVLNLGSSRPPWKDPQTLGIVLGFLIFFVPFGLGLLVLDFAFLRGKRVAMISFCALAIAAIVPWVLYRLHIGPASSWWMILSPICIALLVHRVLFRLLSWSRA